MFFRVMLFVWQFMLDLVAVMRMTADEKDAEIMLLRQLLRSGAETSAKTAHPALAKSAAGGASGEVEE